MANETKVDTSEPIERTTLVGRVEGVIREQVLSGELAPGTRLTETQLASRFKLSRGTIRAALNRLSQEGLIVNVPYTGWAVTRLSPRDIRELQAVYEVLEGLSARLAAECITPEGNERLNDANERVSRAVRRGIQHEVIEADLNLHGVILELSGNNRLAMLYELVQQQLRMYMAMLNWHTSDVDQEARWHDSLVVAIGSGDAERAEKQARENARRSGAVLLSHLDAGESDDGQPVDPLSASR